MRWLLGIVNKTHSLDAEKDRVVKLATNTANLKIAQADKEAARAIYDAATANQKADEAKLKAELANTSVASQQERAAKAERSLLEVQEKLRGRSISEWQRARFREINAGKAKGSLTITALAGDPEAFAFANDLRSLLVDAGWTVPTIMMQPIPGEWSIGLSLNFQSVQHDPSNPNILNIPSNSPAAHGLLLKPSFDEVGISLNRIVSVPRMNEPEVNLVVGHKP